MSSGGFDGAWARRCAGLLLALGASLAACGDGATNGNVDADGGDADVPDSEIGDVDAEAVDDVGSADADAPDGDAALPTTLMVLVTSSSWLYPGEFGPLPGATVALDAPDGRRIEQTTGADGRTTFEDLDWTMGPAAVTAYSPGLLLVSRVGLTGAEGEVQLDLPFPRDYRVRLARLWGYAANMADAAHLLMVTATVPNHGALYTGAGWEVNLVPDVPYSLVAAEFDFYMATPPDPNGWEYFHWLVLERPAATGTENVDLDFADAIPPVVVRGRIELPSRPESPLREDASFSARMTSVESGETAILGSVNWAVLSADGNAFDYQLEHVAPADVAMPMTVADLFVSATAAGLPDTGRATVRVEGYPVDGATLPVVPLDVPEMIAPADPLTPRPVGDPIAWRAFDSGVGVYLEVERTSADYIPEEPIWRIWVPDDATGAEIPELPLAVDPVTFFDRGPFVATVVLYRTADSGAYRTQEIRGPSFVVRP